MTHDFQGDGSGDGDSGNNDYVPSDSFDKSNSASLINKGLAYNDSSTISSSSVTASGSNDLRESTATGGVLGSGMGDGGRFLLATEDNVYTTTEKNGIIKEKNGITKEKNNGSGGSGSSSGSRRKAAKQPRRGSSSRAGNGYLESGARTASGATRLGSSDEDGSGGGFGGGGGGGVIGDNSAAGGGGAGMAPVDGAGLRGQEPPSQKGAPCRVGVSSTV